MKKIAFLFVSLLFSIISNAQVVVSSGSPNVDVQIKRCFASGDDVYIDMVLTGDGRWKSLAIESTGESRLYDDEGNMYNGSWLGSQYGVSFEYDKRSNDPKCIIDIPKDIPRKVRIKIVDVDEYATQFVKITLASWGDRSSAYPFEISIKNLPITRN